MDRLTIYLFEQGYGHDLTPEEHLNAVALPQCRTVTKCGIFKSLDTVKDEIEGHCMVTAGAPWAHFVLFPERGLSLPDQEIAVDVLLGQVPEGSRLIILTYSPCVAENWPDNTVKVCKEDPVNPGHYKAYPIETIDMMLRVFGARATRDFCTLNAFKYRMRAGRKGDAATDFHKEKWYLEKAEEITRVHGLDGGGLPEKAGEA